MGMLDLPPQAIAGMMGITNLTFGIFILIAAKEEEVSMEQTREGRRRRRLRKKYVLEDTDSDSGLRPPGNQNKKVESSSDTESTEAFVDSFFGCSFENAVAEEKSVSKSAGEDNKKKSSGDVQKNRDNKTKNLGNKAEKESPKKKKKKRNEENAVGKCDKKESIVESEKHSGNKAEESLKNKKRKNEDLGRDRILSDEALGDGSKQRKNEEIVLSGARIEDNKKLKKKKREKSKTIDNKANEDVEQKASLLNETV
ncbi:hypothetical protein QJS10_CPA08g01201 [Acorus calamus]|uniref:Uncharacterized protein n=1 Tax=Acorus calamus TaxID=4465 RepID=A0AAV9EEN1_ACOCL|nr:hypothetical protein QJS10_CPA08g01201 [Acorus calamus]